MPDVFEFFYTVGEEVIDGQGHVNNVAYVEWMQSAAVAHSAAQGWPGSRYRELGRGWVARSHKIEYLQPAFAGDRIVVRTWVATMRKVTSVRRYHMFRTSDETLLAKAETTWAFINFATRQPVRIPREITDSFVLVEQ